MIERHFRALFALVAMSTVAAAHQGPDPIADWSFNSRTVSEGRAVARLGFDLTLPASARLATDDRGQSLDFAGGGDGMARTSVLHAADFPERDLSVGVWALIDEAEEVGGLVTAAGEADGPSGWRLGYDGGRFTFSLHTLQGDVTVRGRTPYAKGNWTHVAAVYDGKRAELFVNGESDGVSEPAEGDIHYSQRPFYAIGSTGDAAKPSLRGAIREVSVYDLAARPEWVRRAFESAKEFVGVQRDARSDALTFIVEPYLQFGTTDGMTVMWQTSVPGTTVVHYGEDETCDRSVSAAEADIHEARIEGLAPATQYFYRVETESADGQKLDSGVSTFTTAVEPGTPFAFAVISDTQLNPVVSGKLSHLAWAQRPSFLLHPGDLVDTGVNDSHWTQHFFPGMRPLISRVPFYPVLGNHEMNASNYYEYVSLPSPEYFYDFRYGDSHFFMIDSNRNVGPGSQQYAWLDKALAASDAKWKFACHHHPPYSSDEDDYGLLWTTNKGDRGDLRARELSKLYDQHGVDLVWNGHIHSYERTWPVREGKAVPSGRGPVYMIVGGGGGGLETAGPYRPGFQNNVRHGHHYVMAHVSGDVLEIRSFDLDDRLFDTFTIRKPAE